KPLSRRLEHLEAVSNVAFSPDSKILAYGDSDRHVRFWEVDTGQKHRHEVAGRSALFLPDGKVVAIGGRDRFVRLWDPATGKDIRRFEQPWWSCCLAVS